MGRAIESGRDFFKEAKELTAYAASSPKLVTLLYDCALGEDDVEIGSTDWLRMLVVIDHWRAREREHSEEVYNYRRE